MNKLNATKIIDYFKYQNQLKTVLRNNQTQDGRRESSGEHSWSVAMMVWLLTPNIEEEFSTKIDQTRAIKMALIHDIVEIDAGDVAAWDISAREHVVNDEHLAISQIDTTFFEGNKSEIYTLWHEHDKLETLESKLVKACDQMCPLVYRIVYNSSYHNTKVTRTKLDEMFAKIVGFSETTKEIYRQLADQLQDKNLFDES